MKTYKIIRFFRDNDEQNGQIIAKGLTLEEAQRHCSHPETSSSTCTDNYLEQKYGPWFDGYDEE